MRAQLSIVRFLLPGIVVAAAAATTAKVLAGEAEAPSPPLLDREVERYTLRDGDILTAMRSLRRIYPQLRYGVELVPGEWFSSPLEKNLDLDLKKVSVRSVLDELVAQDPRYMWKADGDFINVLPTDLANDPHYRLNTRIALFEVNNATPSTCFAELHLPNCKTEWWGHFNLQDTWYTKPYEGAPRHKWRVSMAPPRVTIRLDNTTPRQVLNELTRVVGWRGWILWSRHRPGKSEHYLTREYIGPPVPRRPGGGRRQGH